MVRKNSVNSVKEEEKKPNVERAKSLPLISLESEVTLPDIHADQKNSHLEESPEGYRQLSSTSLFNDKEIIPDVTPKEMKELDKELLGLVEIKSESEIK